MSQKVYISMSSSVWPEHDDRWTRQKQALIEDIRATGAPLTEEKTSVPGTRGDLTTLCIVLGTSTVFMPAVVQIVKAWLDRAQDREITVETEVDGKVQRTTVSGKNVSEAGLLKAAGHG